MTESIRDTWGTTEEERGGPFPCDSVLAAYDAACYRGVTIRADAATVFRWLCQLRVAPYSYDWIDNRGRRSPQTLTPGLENLEIGQRVMSIFKLVDFAPNEHITIRTQGGTDNTSIFGDVAVSYVVVSSGETRLIAKILFHYPQGPMGWAMRLMLPWGDLIMMRRQLLNLKRLAEATTDR